MKKTSVKSADGPCCLDEESGLYHHGHFSSVLSQELARLDRWERPLNLILLELPELSGEAWAAFGRLLKDSLRRIDLAARLDMKRVAVILPDADGPRARRWLADFMDQLRHALHLEGRPVLYGRAMARPWEGRQAGDLMALAGASLGGEDVESCFSEVEDAEADSATAIAADERNLLFAGFKALETGPKH